VEFVIVWLVAFELNVKCSISSPTAIICVELVASTVLFVKLTGLTVTEPRPVYSVEQIIRFAI